MAKTKKKDASALRGKVIMSGKLVGRVLNDADKDSFIVLQVLREKQKRENDIIAQLSGWAPTSVWWEACDRKINTTREHLGSFEVFEKMPEWLHARKLRGPSGAPSITRIKGRSYINW